MTWGQRWATTPLTSHSAVSQLTPVVVQCTSEPVFGSSVLAVCSNLVYVATQVVVCVQQAPMLKLAVFH